MRRARGKLFAYTSVDALLCALVTLHFVGLVALALCWRQLDWRLLVLCGIAHAWLVCHHFQCTIHYVMHTPFFTVAWLNRAVQLVGSAVVMSSATSFFAYHMLHHRYGNDPIDATTGKTLDPTSTFSRGKDGRYGGLFATAVIPVVMWRLDALRLRVLTIDADSPVRTAKARRRLVVDRVVVACVLATFCAIDPWFAALYVAATSLGHVYGNIQNYLEHYGAIPGSRATDAASCYSRYYNFLWFNNGYHQEHHYRPGAHWTELPTLRAELPARRRIVCVNYFANLPFVSAPPLFEGRRQDLERPAHPARHGPTSAAWSAST
jgi:fatty acid desaturase